MKYEDVYLSLLDKYKDVYLRLLNEVSRCLPKSTKWSIEDVYLRLLYEGLLVLLEDSQPPNPESLLFSSRTILFSVLGV